MNAELQIMFHTLLIALSLLIAATFYAMSDARDSVEPGERLIVIIPIYSLLFFIPLEIFYWTLYWMFLR